jgi:hypothetical protein
MFDITLCSYGYNSCTAILLIAVGEVLRHGSDYLMEISSLIDFLGCSQVADVIFTSVHEVSL